MIWKSSERGHCWPSYSIKRLSSEVLLAYIFASTLLSDLFCWPSGEKYAWRTTRKYNLWYKLWICLVGREILTSFDAHKVKWSEEHPTAIHRHLHPAALLCSILEVNGVWLVRQLAWPPQKNKWHLGMSTRLYKILQLGFHHDMISMVTKLCLVRPWTKD